MGLKSLVLFAGAASAHFGLMVPEWRGDSLNDEELDQRQYPCALAEPNSGNTTEWPLDGGSLKLMLHHSWDYIFINLGLGTGVSNFNISLTNEFWNSTGNGTLCVPKLTLPADLVIADGDEASLQVVTISGSGSALYNCADIKFSESAELLSDEECETDGPEYYVVAPPEDPVLSTGEVPIASAASSGNSTEEDAEDTDDTDDTDDDGDSAAMGRDVPVFALTAAVGLAFTFAAGLSL